MIYAFARKIYLKEIIIHVIGWSCFIVYELYMYYYTTRSIGSLPRNVAYYACNIGLFYSQVALLKRSLTREKPRYLLFAIQFLLQILVYLAIKVGMDLLFTDFSLSTVSKLQLIRGMAMLDLFRCILFASFGTLYWAGFHIAYLKKKAAGEEIERLLISGEKAALENNLARSQNAYLKQQLNPHLLFNSLNFIYNSVFKYSETAGENVLLLADIMRYSLDDQEPDGKTLLSSEITQMENLILINKHRFDFPLDIKFTKAGETTEKRIIPLVLMTLVENLFKHGDLRQSAGIHLRVSPGGLLTFRTINVKRKNTYRSGPGIGLSNIRTRLGYTYPGHFSLNIKEHDDIYESLLTLQL